MDRLKKDVTDTVIGEGSPVKMMSRIVMGLELVMTTLPML